MTTEKLTEETKENLIGKSIVAAGDNWIQLDNGTRIYLDDSEISNLN